MARCARGVDLLVYAPIGAVASIAEALPEMAATFVGRGRAEVARVQESVDRHVTTVRSTGLVATHYGLPRLRDQWVARLRGRLGAAQPVAPAPPPAPERAPAPAPAPAPRPPTANGDGGAHLPIPGYDELAASQVVDRLAGLSIDELAAVGRYEAAHRNRRTVLGKIEQLAQAT